MLTGLAILLQLLSVSFGSKCGYPNNTDTAIHTFNCNSSMLNYSINLTCFMIKQSNLHVKKNVPMIVTGSRVLDKNEVEMYPIDFKAPMTIELNAINNGEVYQDNKVDVILSQYTSGWLSSTCEWKEVKTFGLLNNIDGCEYANNCPLQTGDLDLRLPLDLSNFGVIINALLGDHAHQLSIHMKNYNPGLEKHEEIACVTAQMKIR
ncbi:unnamed protein product [Enterobius vermicularis]|uniref:ML domain-containing protein n=1 Tax=Enterobius vermicularis TaxID=51028 RepID=A0A0N4VIV0_ENTVE|nr:unnamed protein product [Enterobius vermicularis]